MAIEAPISKFKKSNLKIYIFACVVGLIVFAYDGYLSQYEWSLRNSFYQKHVIDGQPDDYMKFNRYAPIFLLAGAVIFAVWLMAIKDKKISAEENELIIDGKERIPYDTIEKIDKTRFESNGCFAITYKTGDEQIDRKISAKRYDNLKAVLDHLVAKIS